MKTRFKKSSSNYRSKHTNPVPKQSKSPDRSFVSRRKSPASSSNRSFAPRTKSSSTDRPFRPLLVWGKHVVESFLEKFKESQKADSVHERLDSKKYQLHILVDKSGKTPGQLAHAVEMAQSLKIKVLTHRSETEGWPLADIHEGVVHQRICLEVPEYPTEDISLACSLVTEMHEEKNYGCAGIVLDQVQDPRNFGAILRSAAFFGVKFVVYAQNRQADISSLVLKSSAGGAFEINLIPVVNINRALEELKQAGAWVFGTANTPEAQPLNTLPTDRVWICALGNEGTGLRAEVLKNCDFLTKIPGGTKNLDSLNVSVAAGIIMHTLQGQK